MSHNKFINYVLELAKQVSKEEIPVAAIVVEKGQIIAEAFNTRQSTNSILGHAEINALEKAAKLKKSWNLTGCTLYVNLEPCAMCAGAILQAHISEVVFSAYDMKAGAFGSRYNLVTNNLKVIGGLQEEKSQAILKEFFQDLRI